MGTRRQFISISSAAAALSMFPPSIRRALAVPAATKTGSIRDVEHVVILMLENRSFDHYFGALRGVRGFADRHPIPLASGRSVWYQDHDGSVIAPFHLDTVSTSALRTPNTPHAFADGQGAWAQGKLDAWPKFKTPFCMGYYTRRDIPFQYALADAFTICDAYHCSITSGTDPNRIVFFSGSNYNPEVRKRGENCGEEDSEPNNLRCYIGGAVPEPGYTYRGSSFHWPTLPELLSNADVSWRIYQDPNNNMLGTMHGGLAFESFRKAGRDSSLYRLGMSHWSLDHFANDAKQGALPEVSWILPPGEWSEHPTWSSAAHGAEFTSRIMDALTSNPSVWSKTVFFVLFDENDGLFDHAPPPAVPSMNPAGSIAGGATLDVTGEYFSDPSRKHLSASDTVSGTVRPWGLGPRVPMYVISPWTKGGWVNSQLFDHTSLAQFLERRFGISVPNISPWHRAVCGDLTSVFDFENPDRMAVPTLPIVPAASATLLTHIQRPAPTVPVAPRPFEQEAGLRKARPLPYELEVFANYTKPRSLSLTFANTGRAGAVFHVYDKRLLDQIPRRYTVEAGKSLTDEWSLSESTQQHHLWVLGPNGFLREFRGGVAAMQTYAGVHIRVLYKPHEQTLGVSIQNHGAKDCELTIGNDEYGLLEPRTLIVRARKSHRSEWSIAPSNNWYDFRIQGQNFEQRFAGHMENHRPSTSDPLMARS